MEEQKMQVNLEKRVTKIEANPLLIKNNSVATKLRVAAYCRVSTDEEEQLNSYESQIAYYTEAIAKNPSWTFAGVYADEVRKGKPLHHLCPHDQVHEPADRTTCSNPAPA